MIGLETGATYWHAVELLWIFLFPLLYLALIRPDSPLPAFPPIAAT